MALRLGIACIALLGLAACGGDDDDGITIRDAGAADSGSDSGPVGPQVCGSIPAEGFAPLPASCGQRCRNATIQQAGMCEDNECFSNTLGMDPTPPVLVEVEGAVADPIEINCRVCYNWQFNSCIYDSCPTEFETWATCLNMASNPDTECTAQDDALTACYETNMDAVQTCGMNRVPVCFGATATSAFTGPEFNPRSIRLPARLDREAVRWMR